MHNGSIYRFVEISTSDKVSGFIYLHAKCEGFIYLHAISEESKIVFCWYIILYTYPRNCLISILSYPYCQGPIENIWCRRGGFVRCRAMCGFRNGQEKLEFNQGDSVPEWMVRYIIRCIIYHIFCAHKWGPVLQPCSVIVFLNVHIKTLSHFCLSWKNYPVSFPFPQPCGGGFSLGTPTAA